MQHFVSASLRRVALGAASGVALLMLAVVPTLADSHSPAPATSTPHATATDITIEARPLLGGHTRPGSWTAVDVTVGNDGPTVVGELRIRGQQQGRSQYGIQAELPSGARQRFTLYAQTAVFGSRLNIELVAGDQVVASQQVAIQSHEAYSPIAAIIAERPEELTPAVTDALQNPNVSAPTVIALTPADLPPRVEAWAPIDRIVWQDVDAATLTEAQQEALRLWIGAGGRLTILGGSTGVATARGFGTDLLPFDPTHTVDASTTDLAALLGALPADATPVPSLAGTLLRGAILARSGDDVIAAEAGYGRGTVTLVGFDPGTPWIAGSAAADALWPRLLPQTGGPALNPLNLPDDSQIVYALQNLPSVDLPPVEQLLALLGAYIVLIGPVNYLVLRRLDRREWAWITIPALVGVFAFGSYGLGATLKGSDVIVNEIAVVRAAEGTGRGMGQVYVGIYSPSRRSFDVSVAQGALLSNPTSQAQSGQTEQPLDVVFGESASRLRNFEVGFGVLRGFRAEAPADAPNLESDLRLVDGRLEGRIVNRSPHTLENVALVFGGGVEVIPAFESGASHDVVLDVAGSSSAGYALSESIFGATFPRDRAEARAVYTRRAVIDQLFPYGGTAGNDSPLLLAWRDGPVLDIELPGDDPNRVGDGLYMFPLDMTLDAQQVFADRIMRETIIEANAAEAWGDTSGYYLSRGTMTVEARPVAFSGTFAVTSLEIALTQGDMRALRGNGQPLAPLPADEQPDQDDPVGEPAADDDEPPAAGGDDPIKPGPQRPFDTLPDFQLFDRVTRKWTEFPHVGAELSYLIDEPQRYVDAAGSVMFRFVNRTNRGEEFGMEQSYFQLLVRVQGTIS